MLEKEGNEKLCSFYASDYHFEMISLPYIQKELNDQKEIIIFTENNLNETIKNVLDRTNLNEVEKQKIINIDWNENTKEKLNKIKNEKMQDKIIFIKGSKEYINDVDTQIDRTNSNIKIIHCYPIQEVAEEMNQIVKKYDAILNTVGKINM